MPGATPEIATSLNKLAATTGQTPTTAANMWAGHASAGAALELVGALNLKNGTTGLEMDGVCNALAGTTGLPAQEALAVKAGLVSG